MSILPAAVRSADSGSPPPADLLRIVRRPGPRRLGCALVWSRSIDSTNAWVRRLAAAGAREGLLAVADAQTAGRGRLGRRWESPAGLGLYCSLLMHPALEGERLPLLTLAAGVAAARSLRRHAGAPVVLQWPNDLMIRGRKIGGILLEAWTTGRRSRAVVGWGLNLAQRPADFSPPLRRRATSVGLETGRVPPRGVLLRSFLERFGRELAALEAGHNASLLRRYAALSPAARPGARLRLILDGRRRRARSAGLAPDGALRVELPEGMRLLRSADALRIVEVAPCSSP
jgi:BirA family biotin operon repressor/biotin-[acetyl-CoA-carboxylase] ligase